MATSTPQLDVQQIADQMFAILKSLGKFDEMEVRGVINGILAPTERESCFQIIYHRVVANIASLRALNHRQHFQAISMITRNLFELAIDIRLIDRITDAIPKLIIYTEVEKLRCARKIVAYKAANPGITLDDTVYHEFITKQGAGIDAKHLTLWPSKTPGQAQKIDHWSGLDLRSRALKIGDLFVQIYDVQQPQWSWQVHSGITGIVNLKAETFSAIAGSCLKSCADFHKEILAAIIEEFHLDKHDHKSSGKLEGSYWMALPRDQQEAEQILRYHTG
jgi:hypothetical protein